MAVATQSVSELCQAAKAAARELALLDTGTKDRALLAVADALEARVGDAQRHAREEHGIDVTPDQVLINGEGGST